MIKKLLFLLFVISFNNIYSQNNFLDFDGIDDSVEIPNAGSLLANAANITMSCMVFPKSNTSGFPNFDGILGYRNETNFDFYLIQLSSTDVEARFRNSTGTAFTITYTGLVLNQWNQFFLVYNSASGTLKLYSGAAEVGSVTASGSAPASNTDSLKIGLVTFQAFDWYHSGYIDEVSVWDKALSDTDISTIVSNNGMIQNPLSETNLKLYYKFDQGIAYGNNPDEVIINDTMGVQNGVLNNFSLTGNSSNWGSLTPLSVSNFNQNQVKVYPNPAADFIFLSGLNDSSDIKILDITGRLVSNQTLQTTQQKIEVSNLHSGIYFMVINNSQKIKFIKK